MPADDGAPIALWKVAAKSLWRRDVQYTIEARELTSEDTHRPSLDPQSRRVTIEAKSADDAISKFLEGNQSELVSLANPARGRESIATVRKDDSVYLVRIYTA
jgi:hypothetical protein